MIKIDRKMEPTRRFDKIELTEYNVDEPYYYLVYSGSEEDRWGQSRHITKLLARLTQEEYDQLKEEIK